MKNAKVLAVLLGCAVIACGASSCSLLGGDEPAEQVIVDDTPTQAAKADATPTSAPETESSAEEVKPAESQTSIQLPNDTWTQKTNDPKMQMFESPDQGKILIIHGEGEDLSTAIMPDNEDLAITLLKGEGLELGTDFEIGAYQNVDVNGARVISYRVRYVNAEKSEGKIYSMFKYIKNESEYYTIQADVKKEDPDLAAAVQKSIDSFRILTDSALKTAAETPAFSEGQGNSGGAPAVPQDSSAYTEEQLADTNQTRTIYRNSDGYPIVITPKDDGNWTDTDGNTYHFTSDNDVYDQNDVDYYYHGEPGNVRFMSTQQE